ncbi:hypothetical protein [Leifsonia poae]|uniref:hypothetical protein n=1 Tax=Leifsonia poae TaxID=110933 RepID=UPI003D678F7A
MTQLGNGATTPTGDALVVAPAVRAAGAKEFVRMPDIYPTFPYEWVGWDDWLAKVDTMIDQVGSSPDSDVINGWELWNEPDWTWDTVQAGPFDDGWNRTFTAVRALDPTTPIVGPSFSVWNDGMMADFLSSAKAAGTLPDVICWHELTDGADGWEQIDEHVAAYRSLEKSLGISPRPIAIDEYGSPKQMEVPSAMTHYLAQFERTGVASASRAYWHESGTVGGLVTPSVGKPTGVYGLYDWYGALSGKMLRVVPSGKLDGLASGDGSTVQVLLAGQAGQSGQAAVAVSGLRASAHYSVTVERVAGTDRATVGKPATRILSTESAAVDGKLTVDIPHIDSTSAYRLVVKPKD